jgi:type I restriction enzyme S subunit
MKASWHKVRLGEVVNNLTGTRTFEVDDDDDIIDPTITSATHTISVGGRSKGFEVRVRKRVKIEAGDLVFSRLHTQNGAFAFAKQAFQATNTFVPLSVNEAKVTKRFLFWSLHQVVPTLSASDTVGRETFKTDDILALEIQVPPLAEQRRVVAWIEELAARIDEARGLRDQAIEETDALAGSHLGTIFGELAKKYPVHSLGELSSHILDGPHVTPYYLPDGVQGVPFVTVKNMVSGKLSFSDLNYISEQDHEVFSRRCRAEYGDVLYSKDGATRGRPCFVDTTREFSYFVSVALIKPLRERLDGQYVVHLLNSNWIKDRMADKSRGDMIPHIVLREIRAFPVPAPPLLEQRRMVSELNALQAEIESLKHVQVETASELNALLPAILDRAFNGEV